MEDKKIVVLEDLRELIKDELADKDVHVSFFIIDALAKRIFRAL